MGTLITSILDNIDTVTLESELNVLGSLHDVYEKSAVIMENYTGDDYTSFAIFQESKIMDDVKKQGAGQSTFKKILTFIPRLIKALIKSLKAVFNKNKSKSVSTEMKNIGETISKTIKHDKSEDTLKTIGKALGAAALTTSIVGGVLYVRNKKINGSTVSEKFQSMKQEYQKKKQEKNDPYGLGLEIKKDGTIDYVFNINRDAIKGDLNRFEDFLKNLKNVVDTNPISGKITKNDTNEDFSQFDKYILEINRIFDKFDPGRTDYKIGGVDHVTKDNIQEYYHDIDEISDKLIQLFGEYVDIISVLRGKLDSYFGYSNYHNRRDVQSSYLASSDVFTSFDDIDKWCINITDILNSVSCDESKKLINEISKTLDRSIKSNKTEYTAKAHINTLNVVINKLDDATKMISDDQAFENGFSKEWVKKATEFFEKAKGEYDIVDTIEKEELKKEPSLEKLGNVSKIINEKIKSFADKTNKFINIAPDKAQTHKVRIHSLLYAITRFTGQIYDELSAVRYADNWRQSAAHKEFCNIDRDTLWSLKENLDAVYSDAVDALSS